MKRGELSENGEKTAFCPELSMNGSRSNPARIPVLSGWRTEFERGIIKNTKLFVSQTAGCRKYLYLCELLLLKCKSLTKRQGGYVLHNTKRH